MGALVSILKEGNIQTDPLCKHTKLDNLDLGRTLKKNSGH